MENEQAQEMPRYRCHKEVWALKIKSLDYITGKWHLTPENTAYAPFPLDDAYMDKHQPKAGGYYVLYKDGYKSFSPAEAFEDGYTRI
jgi:hypothetical protein